jgi:hypothetical protein
MNGLLIEGERVKAREESAVCCALPFKTVKNFSPYAGKLFSI